jgi:hypothetical protein
LLQEPIQLGRHQSEDFSGISLGVQGEPLDWAANGNCVSPIFFVLIMTFAGKWEACESLFAIFMKTSSALAA